MQGYIFETFDKTLRMIFLPLDTERGEIIPRIEDSSDEWALIAMSDDLNSAAMHPSLIGKYHSVALFNGLYMTQKDYQRIIQKQLPWPLQHNSMLKELKVNDDLGMWSRVDWPDRWEEAAEAQDVFSAIAQSNRAVMPSAYSFQLGAYVLLGLIVLFLSF